MPSCCVRCGTKPEVLLVWDKQRSSTIETSRPDAAKVFEKEGLNVYCAECWAQWGCHIMKGGAYELSRIHESWACSAGVDLVALLSKKMKRKGGQTTMTQMMCVCV